MLIRNFSLVLDGTWQPLLNAAPESFFLALELVNKMSNAAIIEIRQTLEGTVKEIAKGANQQYFSISYHDPIENDFFVRGTIDDTLTGERWISNSQD